MTPAPPDQKPAAPIQSVGAAAETVRESDKIMLVLAYFGVFALIPLLTVKDSEYVKWHAKQGLVVAIGFVVLSIIAVIPFIGWLLGCVGWLGLVVVDVMAMTKALKGERWRIPVLADVADKF